MDATGCGDTFLAAFLSRRIRGDSAAARFATVAASLHIEIHGPFRGTPDDIKARWAEYGRSMAGASVPMSVFSGI